MPTASPPAHQKVLLVDAASGFYRLSRYPIGAFFGPVDLGLYLTTRYQSLNLGVGLLAGSILPGSNRLVVSGLSPCWGGFFVSSMGGAGLIFDNLGINMLAIVGRAAQPSLLRLNRMHGEEIDVQVEPLDISTVWRQGRGGVYGLTDELLARYGDQYPTGLRILAVGPAASATDFGAIGSVVIAGGAVTSVDTWAGRGGLGSRLLQQHGIAAVVFGGTFADEDFRDRQVADGWFQQKYQQRLSTKDLEATVKYRYDPKLETGGTLGVNFATVGGRLLAFNYRSIDLHEDDRIDLHRRWIESHYLRQFNEETIAGRHSHTCGEPCPAVCKKTWAEFKKDFEPYQALGPLCGIFDQRAAERLAGHADRLGFDAISAGGVVAWLLDCLDRQVLDPADAGVTDRPAFDPTGFAVETDSMHNATLGVALLDAIIERRGLLDFRSGARRLARYLARAKGPAARDPFVYAANGRDGWMVPNQYWTPGVLSPMPIAGKYYMYYGPDFVPPRALGRMNADRLRNELLMDNLGMCRFHRLWAEEMLPEIVGMLFGLKEEYLQRVADTASRLASRNASMFWESSRSIEMVRAFLRRQREVEGNTRPELLEWLDRFEQDRNTAALDFWYEIHKGMQQALQTT